MSNESRPSPIVFDELTPTLFVDFDGTLHRGRALLDEGGQVSLDTGNSVLEFAPLLEELLLPYPSVRIVLTTSWLNTLPTEQVISFLPPALAARVAGTTLGFKMRFGYMQDGSARTYVIRSYVFEHHLKNWLALDDSVFGAHHLSTYFLDLEPHLVLLDSKQGIGDPVAQRRILAWLAEMHKSRV